MIYKRLKQPFTENFPGDFSMNTMQRQTPNVLFALTNPIGFKNAKMIHFNESLMNQLNINLPLSQEDKDILNANPLQSTNTYATAYAGHQFGHWAGQLGDGRAILLGELYDNNNHPIELQWKGAGATPYSRNADGRAVLRSTIREYLMSETMHHLGIATTRGLSISLSGEQVMRDILYNGNAKPEPGAVMVRTAESFIRFGHFEFLTANNHIDLLQDLCDWVIKRHYPEISDAGADKYLSFFRSVQNNTIKMIIDWYRVGFVHGVMNTDNMSILGLTIDYGPFAMLEEYNLGFTPNTTDLPGKRYAFGQQGSIALWNLNALANALFPLINDADALQEILDDFETEFWGKFDEMMAKKLGLDTSNIIENQKIIKAWQILMLKLKADYNLFFVELIKYRENKNNFNYKSFTYHDLTKEEMQELNNFLDLYNHQIMNADEVQSLDIMRENNPQFILRNYLLYDAIQDAENMNFDKFLKLYDALQSPYENKYPELQRKRPDWANGVAGCSMLSCSS